MPNAYIFLFIIAFVAVLLIIGSVYSRLIEKSWASLSLLIAASLFSSTVVLLLLSIIGLISDAFSQLIGIALVVSLSLFIMGLWGFILRSKKLFSQKYFLLAEKNILTNELNTLRVKLKKHNNS